MSLEGRMAADTARQIFDGLPKTVFEMVEAGEWPAATWARIQEAGLPLALVPEMAGGFGLPLEDGLELIRLSGWSALPLPLAETMIANWLLAQAGMTVGDEPLTILDGAVQLEGMRVSVAAARVPWARFCDAVGFGDTGGGTRLVRLRRGALSGKAGANLAGEPRDALEGHMVLDPADVATSPCAVRDMTLAGAAMRAIQLSGAIERVMEMTIGFVQEREQFGRALGAFQVIQHQVAQLAGETAAARVAADLAIEALASGVDPNAIAAAKIRTGEAASRIAAVAHQLHGAMGFTREYRLQLFTRRLWAWRDEFGSEAVWSKALGSSLGRPGASLWPEITRI